jgi:hypothetical protein
MILRTAALWPFAVEDPSASGMDGGASGFKVATLYNDGNAEDK